jgi:hypothetical protein
MNTETRIAPPDSLHRLVGARPCPCGKPRRKGHIVCIDCWLALDHGTQSDLRSISRTRKPAAVRKALEFAKARAERPNAGTERQEERRQ